MRKRRGEASEPEAEIDGWPDIDRHLQLLRAWIEKSGKTPREVAEASGMSFHDLSATLRGDRPLTYEELLKVIVALGKEPRDFFLDLCGELPATADALDAVCPPTTSSSGSDGD
jgi:transcriptional regulator with XRE-family HTH domain